MSNILSLDPGKEFFAWCLVSDRGKVIDFGMMPKTITDIRDMYANSQVKKFRKAMRKLVLGFKDLHEIAMERFQQRPGKGGGANAEFINIMIGVVATICVELNLRVTLVQASTWKNHMASRYSPKLPAKPTKSGKPGRPTALKQTQAERYGYRVSKTSKTAPIKDHEFDAIGIAQWVIEKNLERDMMPTFKKQLDSIWKARDAKKQRRGKSRK